MDNTPIKVGYANDGKGNDESHEISMKLYSDTDNVSLDIFGYGQTPEEALCDAITDINSIKGFLEEAILKLESGNIEFYNDGTKDPVKSFYTTNSTELSIQDVLNNFQQMVLSAHRKAIESDPSLLLGKKVRALKWHTDVLPYGKVESYDEELGIVKVLITDRDLCFKKYSTTLIPAIANGYHEYISINNLEIIE